MITQPAPTIQQRAMAIWERTGDPQWAPEPDEVDELDQDPSVDYDDRDYYDRIRDI